MKKILDEILRHQFFTKYQIDKKQELGAGGCGVVLAAKELQKNGKISKCAIKIQYDKNVDAGEQEIKILQKLETHPHIIRYKEYFPEPEEQNKLNFNAIVMERAEKSLTSFLEENSGKLTKRLLFHLFLDALSGMGYAHSKQVNHGDIKLGNILVSYNRVKEKFAQNLYVSDPNLIFKLCDWGIGNLTEKNITKTQTIAEQGFSLGFAAPEIRFQEVGKTKRQLNLAKVDIYSLAMVLLHCCGINKKKMLSLCTLLEKNYYITSLNQILNDSQLKEDYGEAFVKLIESMAQWDINSRVENTTKIQKEMKTLIKEIKEEERKDKKSGSVEEEEKKNSEKCCVCGKIHEGTLTLNCHHVIGISCFEEYYSSRLDKDPLFRPKCPVRDCPKGISSKNFIRIIAGEEDQLSFIRYFSKCEGRACNSWNFRQFITEISCGHLLCRKCLSETLTDPICKAKNCEKKISSKDRDSFVILVTVCWICEASSKTYFTFRCCNLHICGKCLEEHFFRKYLKFKRGKHSQMSCIYCWKNFTKLKPKEIFDEDSYQLFRSLTCSKCLLPQENEESQFEILEKCKHQLCESCLQAAIHKNLLCPVRNCGKKIPVSLLEKENISVLRGNKTEPKRWKEFDRPEAAKTEKFEQKPKQKNRIIAESSIDDLNPIARKFYEKMIVAEKIKLENQINDTKRDAGKNESLNLKEKEEKKSENVMNEKLKKHIPGQKNNLENDSKRNSEPLIQNLKILSDHNVEKKAEKKKKGFFCQCQNQTEEGSFVETSCAHVLCKTCVAYKIRLSKKKIEDFVCPVCGSPLNEELLLKLSKDIFNCYAFLLSEIVFENWKKEWEEEKLITPEPPPQEELGKEGEVKIPPREDSGKEGEVKIPPQEDLGKEGEVKIPPKKISEKKIPPQEDFGKEVGEVKI